MRFNQRSDVKNHLSTRASSIVLPFPPVSQPDITGDSENKPRSTEHVPSSGKSVAERMGKKSQA